MTSLSVSGGGTTLGAGASLQLGKLGVGTPPSVAAQVIFTSLSAGQYTLLLTRLGGQTADLLHLQDEAGSPLLRAAANGDLLLPKAGAKLVLGDATLYRESASRLKTDGALHVVGNLSGDGTINAAGGLLFNGSNINGSGVLTNVVYAGAENTFGQVQHFAAGFQVGGGVVSIAAPLAYVNFGTAGIELPRYTTRSQGTRLVYFPAVTSAAADYATGIYTNTLWTSVPTSSQRFVWYAGTTQVASLSGTGNLLTLGYVDASELRVAGVPISAGGASTAAANSWTALQTFALNARLQSTPRPTLDLHDTASSSAARGRLAQHNGANLLLVLNAGHDGTGWTLDDSGLPGTLLSLAGGGLTSSSLSAGSGYRTPSPILTQTPNGVSVGASGVLLGDGTYPVTLEANGSGFHSRATTQRQVGGQLGTNLRWWLGADSAGVISFLSADLTVLTKQSQSTGDFITRGGSYASRAGNFSIHSGWRTGATVAQTEHMWNGVATGAVVTAAGQFTSASDRRKKTDFQEANHQATLAWLDQLPVPYYRFKSEAPGTQHLGPVAQDFHAWFKLGADDTTINLADGLGVALSAIKGLQRVIAELRTELHQLTHL